LSIFSADKDIRQPAIDIGKRHRCSDGLFIVISSLVRPSRVVPCGNEDLQEAAKKVLAS